VGDLVSERLVAGIAAQDEAAISACFAPDAEFRALTPAGLRERHGGAEVGALIAGWFGDSTVLGLEDARTAQVADRLHIVYRFTGIEEGEPYVVEQQIYCTVRDDLIAKANLLCSGFRPR
jgi:hypothetical protein